VKKTNKKCPKCGFDLSALPEMLMTPPIDKALMECPRCDTDISDLLDIVPIGEKERAKEEAATSDKPVLVIITSEGQPLENEHLIDRILALPDIQREVAGRRCRVRTFGGNPTGWNPSEEDVMQHAFAMQIVHARDYQRPKYWCTVTNPADGRKYQVAVCQP